MKRQNSIQLACVVAIAITVVHCADPVRQTDTYYLVKAGGDSAVQKAGSELETPVTVQVRNPSAEPAAGVSVNWQVLTGSGSVSKPIIPSAADGTSTVEWKLGPVIGDQTLMAYTASGDSVVFHATALPTSAIDRFNFIFARERDYTVAEYAALIQANLFFTRAGKYLTAQRDIAWVERVKNDRPGAPVLVYEITYGRSPEWTDYEQLIDRDSIFLIQNGVRQRRGSYDLFDIRSPATAQYLVQTNTDWRHALGADGFFLDNMNCVWSQNTFNCSDVDRFYRDIMIGLRTANPSASVIYNGVLVGYGLADNNTSYAEVSDGVMIERWVEADCVNTQPPAVTKKYLEALVELERRGKIVMASSIWACGTGGAEEVLERYETALAVYYLGSGPKSFFRFRVNQGDAVAATLGRTDLNKIVLGRPVNESSSRFMEVTPDVFERKFVGGMVVWNASGQMYGRESSRQLYDVFGRRLSAIEVPSGHGKIYLYYAVEN